MASRFYRPLEEDANDPRYVEGSPFDGDPAAYDTPQESPFAENKPSGAPPPSVRETKAAKPDPFADDPNDPIVKRLGEIDQQLASRPRSIGGMIAAFSPHGDKTLHSLMEQRQMYGREHSGDQQLRRQMAGQQAAQERAFAHDKAIQANAERAAQAREEQARINSGGRVVVGSGHDAARMYAADRGYDSTQYRTDNQQFAPKGLAPQGMFQDPTTGQWMGSVFDPNTGKYTTQSLGGKLVKPGTEKPEVDPNAVLLQKKLVTIQQSLIKLQATDPQNAAIPELQRQYNEAKRQAGMFGKTPAASPQPSAAPSTAPAVRQTAPDGGIVKSGNKGQDSTGKVFYEQPDGSYVAADGTPYKVN